MFKRTQLHNLVAIGAVCFILILTIRIGTMKSYHFEEVQVRPIWWSYRAENAFDICCVMFGSRKSVKKLESAHFAWAQYCRRLIVVGSNVDNLIDPRLVPDNQNITYLHTPHDDHSHLYERTLKSMKHIRTRFRDECPWILKADDDTFVHMKNLRDFLATKTPDKPIVFGHRFRTHLSGGAGYVLSRAALDRVDFELVDDCGLKGNEDRPEDKMFSQCLSKSGVLFGKTIDGRGRQYFNAISLSSLLHNRLPEWMLRYNRTPIKTGIGFCSKKVISFHYVKPETMPAYNSIIETVCANS